MKVRVRHDPSGYKYVIEIKKGIFSDWAYESCSYYSSTAEGESFVFQNIEKAKESAIKHAKYLLEDSIVWEGSSK